MDVSINGNNVQKLDKNVLYIGYFFVGFCRICFGETANTGGLQSSKVWSSFKNALCCKIWFKSFCNASFGCVCVEVFKDDKDTDDNIPNQGGNSINGDFVKDGNVNGDSGMMDPKK